VHWIFFEVLACRKRKDPTLRERKKLRAEKEEKRKDPHSCMQKKKRPHALSLSFQANTLAGVMIFAGEKGHKVTSCLFTTNDLSKAQALVRRIEVVPLMCI